MLRDVLVREEPLVFKPGQFYVLAAFAGCLLFTLLALQCAMDATSAALITVGATFVFRVLAIQFNWKTSPVWKEAISESPRELSVKPAPAPQTKLPADQPTSRKDTSA